MSERSIGFELSTRHPSLLPEINNPQPSLTAFTQARRPYPQALIDCGSARLLRRHIRNTPLDGSGTIL
jgi:hypothetical protein